ncbi:MAG: CSLREA domain-containing protein, partial [Acidobacteriota bacterium]
MTTTQDENGDNPSACSLREAVTTLNGGASFGGCVFTQGDTLIELGAGTHELSLDLGTTDRVTLFVPMTIRGQGPQATIIERVDPLDDDLLLVILSEPGAVTLDGFTIRGATGPSHSAIDFIVESGVELTLRDLVIADNVASSSPFNIQGEADGIARLERVVFENNRNLGDNSGGGGLECDTEEAGLPPSLFLEDVIFRGNVATEEIGEFGAFGGAMVSQGCNLTLENVTFDSNSAVGIENDSFGGALFLRDYTGTSTQVELTNVTFFDNTADLGGAMLQFSAGNPLDT